VLPSFPKLDVFSLGILFHQYLTGAFPGYDQSEYSYLHEAVLDGHPAEISDEIRDAVDYIVDPSLEKGSTGQSSSIIKVGLDYSIEIIRK
jgi:hypothetical protein